MPHSYPASLPTISSGLILLRPRLRGEWGTPVVIMARISLSPAIVAAMCMPPAEQVQIWSQLRRRTQARRVTKPESHHCQHRQQSHGLLANRGLLRMRDSVSPNALLRRKPRTLVRSIQHALQPLVETDCLECRNACWCNVSQPNYCNLNP